MPGADPADPCNDPWDLFRRLSLDEFFEPPYGLKVDLGVPDITVIIQLNRNGGMSFNPGNGGDIDGT
jgi:hypothetical protein